MLSQQLLFISWKPDTLLAIFKKQRNEKYFAFSCTELNFCATHSIFKCQKNKSCCSGQKKKDFRPFSELVCTNEFFCRRNSWNYFCMKQQTWYFCLNGNKIVESKKLTRHELQINKKIRSKHAQEGSLFIPSSFDRLSQL